MALGGSHLGQEFEQNWWPYLCSQAFQHYWDTSSFLLVFAYGVLLHRISSGCGRKPEESCPWLLLSSCVLRSLGQSLRAEVVVLPVLTGISALQGDQLSHGGISVWRIVIQDQLLRQT